MPPVYQLAPLAAREKLGFTNIMVETVPDSQADMPIPVVHHPMNVWRTISALQAILMIVCLVGAYFLYKNDQETIFSLRQENAHQLQKEATLVDQQPKSSVQVAQLPTVTGWKKFDDPEYHVTFEYPENWTVQKMSKTRLAVTNKSQLCDNCDLDPDTYAVVIDDAEKLPKGKETADALVYLCGESVDHEKAINDCPPNERRKNGLCPPKTGTFGAWNISLTAPFFGTNFSTAATGGEWQDGWYNWPSTLDNKGGNFYFTALFDGQYRYQFSMIAPENSWLNHDPTSDEEKNRSPQHPLVHIMRSLYSTLPKTVNPVYSNKNL